VVSHSDFEGSYANIFFKGSGNRDIILNAVNDGSMPDLSEGTKVGLRFAPENAVVLPPGEFASD